MMNENIKSRNLTCIVCPRGCQMTVEIGDEISVSGNLCPRGKVYAKNECIDPHRTVTSTVRTNDGGVVAVKTEGTIKKAHIIECMKLINSAVATLPVRVGDVIIADAFGTRIVATQNKE
jgi:CxxC motif-containing protein